MRSFSFHAKTIGKERYLTYILGEGMELDEDTLDFLEDENPAELVRVIFEQEDFPGKVYLGSCKQGDRIKDSEKCSAWADRLQGAGTASGIHPAS